MLGIASLAARMAARNPRLGKRIFDLIKKPKGIAVYRGDTTGFKSLPKSTMAKMYSENQSKVLPFSQPKLRELAMGRWFTQNPEYARGFAGSSRFLPLSGNLRDILKWGGGYRPGLVQKIMLSPKEAKLARQTVSKIHGHKMPPSMYVVPKNVLKRAKKDQLQTFIANFYRMIGKKKGGLAQIMNI